MVLGPRPPPAAIAPGPAGLGVDLGVDLEATFFAPAFGAALTFEGADDSSSASSRAFSAFRASSALRLSSLSSCFLLVFEPSCHFSASLRSWIQEINRIIRARMIDTDVPCPRSQPPAS